MKLIYAGPQGSTASNWGNFLSNCKRNKSCEKAYFVPIRSLSDVSFYADLPGKPVTYEATLLDLCNPICGGGGRGDFNQDYNEDFYIGTNCIPRGTAMIFNSYVVAQKPDNAYYGVFGAPNDIPGMKYFFIRFVFHINGGDYVYYSEQFEIEDCDPLILVRACYPNEDAPANATDVNGIYYGFPATSDVLGAPNYRYFHWAFVRKGSIIQNKATIQISFFNNQKPYKSTNIVSKVFEFELIPTFYMKQIYGMCALGYIEVAGNGYKLYEEQSWTILDTTSKLWAMDVILDEQIFNYFGCGPLVCQLPPSDSAAEPVACLNAPTEVNVENGPIVISGPSGDLIINGRGTFTGGNFNTGDSIEWQILEGSSLVEQGTITQAPLVFYITALDFDLTTHCYTVRWRKKCSNGFYTEWAATNVGNCSNLGGACHTYLVEYNGLENANITYKDCDGVDKNFLLFPGTSQQICAKEGTITSTDNSGTVITDQGLGCNSGVVCEEYINNSGSPVTEVNFTNCAGEDIAHYTVNPGDSICIRQGTGGGNFGFLTFLGNCSPSPICYSYEVTATSNVTVFWIDCPSGQQFSSFLMDGQTGNFCSRTTPTLQSGTATIAPNPSPCSG